LRSPRIHFYCLRPLVQNEAGTFLYHAHGSCWYLEGEVGLLLQGCRGRSNVSTQVTGPDVSPIGL
jgi:hypothetical protein